MEKRKALINEYKERKITGGIYRVVNIQNGMYLLDYNTNIQARQNAFNFSTSTGSCFHLRLKKDWEIFGVNAFTFEILETLEKHKDQTQTEFVADLETLLQMWSEKLDSSKRY